MLPTDANAGPPLRRRDLDPDPFRLFDAWFREAQESEGIYPEAMTLATVREDGSPAARVVLMKELDERGIVFYTNYESHKADEMGRTGKASLVFWWRSVQRQVRIEGSVEKVTPEESDEYFATRPRGSQLSAWASHQSAAIGSRRELEDRMVEYLEKFHHQDVPRPPHWGGYRVVPERWEFWQGRADRLHDRFEYLPSGNGWEIRRLAP